jgi:acetyl esterase/lipase
MPSRRHQALAAALPTQRRARELDSAGSERERLERWHDRLGPRLPTAAVPGFARHWSVVTEDLGFPSYVVAPRGRQVRRTIYFVHGGGFVAPIDAFHLRYATRLARRLDARVVMPDYPLTPEHTWKDSHDTLVDHAARWAAEPGGIVLVGDSAGGNIALAMAVSMRDRALPVASSLVLHAPWVDLTESHGRTAEFAARDTWLFPGKLRAYADWWGGGSGDDLARPEVSPGLAELDGLPRTIMLWGTRDLIAPGCQALADRSTTADWDLTTVEEPDLIHVYGLMPGIPEAGRAFRQVLEFCR